MAIKSINELTAMTTADLTANDVLVVGTSSGAKKIPAQDAFSGGGSSTPDILVTCTCDDEPSTGTFSALSFVANDTIPNIINKLVDASLNIKGNCKWTGNVGDMYSFLTINSVGVIPQATLAQLSITSETDGLVFDISIESQIWDSYIAYTSNGQIVFTSMA